MAARLSSRMVVHDLYTVAARPIRSTQGLVACRVALRPDLGRLTEPAVRHAIGVDRCPVRPPRGGSIFNPAINIDVGVSGVASNRAQDMTKFQAAPPTSTH